MELKIEQIQKNLNKIENINFNYLDKETLIVLVNLNFFIKPKYEFNLLSIIELEEILNKTNSIISESQKIKYIKKILFPTFSIYEYQENYTIYLKEDCIISQVIIELKQLSFKEIQIIEKGKKKKTIFNEIEDENIIKIITNLKLINIKIILIK